MLHMNKIFFIELFLVFILKALFAYAYFYISHYLNIDALYSFDFNIIKYLFSLVIAIFIFLILSYKKNLNIYPIFLLLYILYILPVLVYFSLSNQEYSNLFLLLTPYILIVYLTFNINKKLDIKYNINLNYILIFSFTITSIVLIHLIKSANGNFVTSLNEIYAYRILYEDISMKGIWGYLNSWVFKVFSLLLLLISIYLKNYKYLVVSLLLICLLFLFSGHKSVFLSLFIVLFFFVWYKVKWNIMFFLVSLIIIFSSIIIFTLVYPSENLVISIFIRRLLFVPSVLSFSYIEFFSANEFVYWSNSFLKSYFIYPYDKNFALLMGNYLGMQNTYANTGFLAMGYMHAGLLGVFIYTCIVILLFNFINNLIVPQSKFIQISLVFVPLYIFFVSSDLLTTLLTHGLFIVLIVMLFLFFTKNKKISST